MTMRNLEEEFRSLGLSEKDTRDSLGHMGMLTEGDEARVDDSDEEEDFGDTFLSSEEGWEEEDDDLGEGLKRTRTHKTSAAAKRKSKQYYKGHKQAISRKRRRRAKSSAGKRSAALLARMPKGGSRVRRVVSDRDVSTGGGLHEGLIGELCSLAEAIDRDPSDRFQEYVEAFNYIADLGELLALRAINEDEDAEAAEIVMGLSVMAEDVLRGMSDLDGFLTPEQDAQYEETLNEALEDVWGALSAFELLSEDDDDDFEYEEDDDQDEDFYDEDLDESSDEMEQSILDIAYELREASKGAKSQPRPPKGKKRKLLAPGKTITVKGDSAWGDTHGAGASKKQIAGRSDVRNQEALLNYLKLVKSGKVAPGQKVNKGAMKAMKAKGKGYKGKAKAG